MKRLITTLLCVLLWTVAASENATPNKKRFDKCSITILVETDNKYASLSMPVDLTIQGCFVDYVYLISSYISYDEEFIQGDEAVDDYYILRNNYPDNGYLPFIMSLLHTSKYTMIIKDDGFVHEYTDEAWIEKAISQLNGKSMNDIVTCHIEKTSKYGPPLEVPQGCMFLSSLNLRSIITKTQFQRNAVDPFLYFSQAFSCKFNGHLIEVPSAFYNPPAVSYFASFKKSPIQFTPEELSQACITTLSLESVHCTLPKKGDRTIGVLLSQYKRQYIYEQVPAIYKSSVKVHDILVYQNENNYNYHKLFLEYPEIHHVWATNWNSPFFLRHLLPMLFQTHYHIVFDDDIIPGVDTILTLLQSIDHFDAPSGVGGRIINESKYLEGTYQMICVDCDRPSSSVEVDYVIQTYAKTELMTKVFWRYRPYTHRNGDDMHTSLSWYMECGRHPFRPFFPPNAAYKNYGSDSVASYKTKTHHIVRPQTFRSWILGGFKGIMDKTVRSGFPPTREEWEQKHLNEVMRYF